MLRLIYRKFFSIVFLLVAIAGLAIQSCTHNKTDQRIRNTFKTYSPTEGGKGGQVIKVTNLESDGKGSLRAAVHKMGPRIIVFEVGGIINLGGNSIDINQPNITIAGQTAPSPGITLIRGGIKIKANDVIVQHLTVRPGDVGKPKESGWETDGIATSKAHNVWIDHCSVTWATDEGISASGPRLKGVDSTSHNITFSNNLIAEGLSHSTHSHGEHSKGSLIHDNSRYIFVIGNLYVHNQDRNPYFKTGSTGIIINNLVYNAGDHAIRTHWVKREWKGHKPPPVAKITIVGNVLIPGQNTTSPSFIYGDHAELYIKGNKIMGNRKDLSIASGPFERAKRRPIWHDGIKVMQTDKVYDFVLSNAGARPKDRSANDRRIVKSVKERTGHIIDSQKEVGGYPHLKPVHRGLTIPKDNVQKWLSKMAKAVE